MSQRSNTIRSPRTSTISGNYMGSRPSLGAAKATSSQPRQCAVVSLLSDDEEPPQTAKQTEVVDLVSPSASPSPRPSRPPAGRASVPRRRSPLARPPLPPLSRDSSPDGQASSSISPLMKDSFSNEPGHRVHGERPATNQTSSPKIKNSPQTLENQLKQAQRNEPSSLNQQTPRRNPRDSTPQLSEEEDEAITMHYDEDDNLPPSPGTPSKQASSRGHPRSQKSTDFSIGSSSPLITRLKQRRDSKQINGTPKARSQSPREVMARRSLSSEHASDREPITQEGLETLLEGFASKLKDDHAFGMKWLLQDVRETVADRKSAFFKSPFIEKGGSSPWAFKQGLQVRPGQEIGRGAHVDKLDSFVMAKSRLSKTRSQLVGSLITTDLPRVPKYYSHTNVKRNILTADDEKLKFIPFLGDLLGQGAKKQEGHKRLLKELEEAYSATRISSSRETERASSLRSHLDIWLKQLKVDCNQQDLMKYILNDDDSCAELRLKPRDRKALLASFREPVQPKVHEAAAMMCEAFQNVFNIPLHDVILPTERVKEMTEAVGKPVSKTPEKPSDAPADRLETYTTLTCMLCGAIDCPTHGDYQQEEIKRSEDEDSEDGREANKRDVECVYYRQPLILEYGAMIRRYEIRRSKKEAEAEEEKRIKHKPPCSDECYRLVDHADREYEWHQNEIDALPQMLLSLTNKDRRSCTIAFAMDRPCWQVHSEIAAYEADHPYTPIEIPESTARAKAPNWYDNKRKVLKGDWQDLTAAHLHQERAQANPCGHEGPCTNICPCFQANLLCESFCGCPDDCPRKFTGCACLASGIACVSDSCICIQMNRECGPQCGTCGAIDRINPAMRHNDELFKTGCQNIVLQRGVAKQLVMGESQLEGVGFGLYVVEPVQKGDYLSEYAGEVVSSAEAERRGIIYDRKFLSFLFDLNGDWVIDAARYGNKTRFINHADNEKDGLNCEAKIVLVNGEHRIKFVALRDINVGEELLFNYGKKFAEKHGLSKKLPKVKEGGKKGVLVGEEALDALDGMDSRKRDTRGKMSAIRGGGGGGGRGGGKAKGNGNGKMRKSARPQPEPVLEVEMAVDVDGDGDVEMGDGEEEEDGESGSAEEGDGDGDEGGEVSDGRRRRRIKRPARYTR